MSNVLDIAKNGYGRTVDGLTSGYIKGEHAIRNFSLKKGERGSIVEVVLITAVIVVIVVVVGKIIYDNVVTAANNTGNCIKSANKVSTGSVDKC